MLSSFVDRLSPRHIIPKIELLPYCIIQVCPRTITTTAQSINHVTHITTINIATTNIIIITTTTTMTYRFAEPHPSAAPSSRIHTGRGGSGNTTTTPSYASETSTSRTAAAHPLLLEKTPSCSSITTPSNRFSSGRGGAGNIHPLSQAALYDFDTELEQATTRDEKRSAFHVGRGGAANYAVKKEGGSAERKMSIQSVSSNGSAKSGVFSRLAAAVERA